MHAALRFFRYPSSSIPERTLAPEPKKLWRGTAAGVGYDSFCVELYWVPRVDESGVQR